MASAVLGLVIDTTVMISAARRGQPVVEALRAIRQLHGELPIVLSAVSLTELSHGVQRAQSPDILRRREAFYADLKANIAVVVPSQRVFEAAGRLGGDLAREGFTLAVPDLLIAATALDQGYHVVTANVRDFQRIPGLGVLPA